MFNKLNTLKIMEDNSNFSFKDGNFKNIQNLIHTNSKSFNKKMSKKNFPVLNSLITINNSVEFSSTEKKPKKTILKKNLTDIFRREDYLISIIYKILEKEKIEKQQQTKGTKKPEKVIINLFDDPSKEIYKNNLNINSCVIKSNSKKRNNNIYYNYLNDLKSKHKNKTNCFSPKKNKTKTYCFSPKKNKNNNKNTSINNTERKTQNNFLSKIEPKNNLINVNIKINNNNISLSNEKLRSIKHNSKKENENKSEKSKDTLENYKIFTNIEITHPINEQINSKNIVKKPEKKEFKNILINKIINLKFSQK